MESGFRLLLAFLIVALLLILVFAPSPEAKTIVAMGDSISWGYGAWPLKPGYAEIVAAEIERQGGEGVILHNLARPGDTAAEMQEQIGRALALAPEIVLVSIGGNDLLDTMEIHGDVEAALLEAARHTKEALISLRAPGRVLVLLGLFNPYPPFSKMHRYGAWGVQHFESIFSEVAAETGAIFVPLADGFAGNERDFTWSDRADFHPTPAGHKLIADRVLKALGYEPSRYSPPEERPWLMVNSHSGYVQFLTMSHWLVSGVRLGEDGISIYVPQGSHVYQDTWFEIGYDRQNEIRAGIGWMLIGRFYMSASMLVTGPRQLTLQLALLEGAIPVIDTRFTTGASQRWVFCLNFAF